MSRWSDRRLRRLAWAGWWLIALLGVFNLYVSSLGQADYSAAWGSSALGEYAFAVVVLTFPLVGLLVLVRQPRNRVGWLLHAVGFSWAVPGLLTAYAHYGLVVDPGSLPRSEEVAAVNEATWTWGILLMGVYLVLLFPDGRLPSPRWRYLAWFAAIAGGVLGPLGIVFSPGTLEEAPVRDLENPLATASLEPLAMVWATVGLPAVPLCILAAAWSLVARFRRSDGIERQQIKWLAAAGVGVALLFAITLAATLMSDLDAEGRTDGVPVVVRALQEASILSFLLLPLSIGVAILRYRLFDIDLVINRALVYGSLTATLAGIYLGSVLLLQQVLRPLTNESDLAVAGSTLAVAAIFGPARRRIQEAVDRRFYRRRYDAARALDSFAGRLRHQVDLDAVGAELLAACHETVQPTQVSVWLPETRRTS